MSSEELEIEEMDALQSIPNERKNSDWEKKVEKRIRRRIIRWIGKLFSIAIILFLVLFGILFLLVAVKLDEFLIFIFSVTKDVGVVILDNVRNATIGG